MGTSSLFFGSEPKQALRISRFLMGAATYLMTVLIGAILVWQGFLDSRHYLALVAVMVLLNLGFYATIRSGANLRFRDPSLTFAQILAASLLLLPLLYLAGEARGALLLLYLVALVFGVLRLSQRQFLLLGGIALINYGVVVLALWLQRPEALNLRLELVQWMALAMVMPAFGLLGGYISGIRTQLRGANRQLEGAMTRIQEMAIRDELTGVHNRRHIMALLANEKNRADRAHGGFCICVLDIDHFKQVNDRYGHPAGDEILRRVAQTARDSLRTSDAFGRYGGEEFIVMAIQTSAAQALVCAERIRREVAECRFPGIDPELRITVSIGLTDYRPPEDYMSTIERADQALYRAKDQGRNQVQQN